MFRIKYKQLHNPVRSAAAKISAMLLTGGFLLSLSGCAGDMATYDEYNASVSAESNLNKVGSTFNTESYSGEPADYEDATDVYKSDDGLCVIEKKPSYFEIYLDYTGGDYYAVGCAYAETISKVDLEFAALLEPYLYENIKMAFPNLYGDYAPVGDRIEKLLAGIREEYRQEMEGFATTISEGRRGFTEDGLLSYEEALLIHIVPDCLRGTNCNAFSAWGDKTESGERIVSRTLEWTLGSENQMCLGQAVTHFKMPEGKNSYTTFSVMGMLDVLTGINDDGVFAGILDVSSEEDYVCDGKKCYTYELRYALENMNDARSIGEYMIAESKNFTYSHNIIITDKKDCLVAEDCVQDFAVDDAADETATDDAGETSGEESKGDAGDTSGEGANGVLADASKDSSSESDAEDENRRFVGKSVLRDEDTPLTDGLTWDNPDSLCVVNSFVTEGNRDFCTINGGNYVRFVKYNAWAGEKEKLSLSDVKDIVTRETEDKASRFQKIHSENVFQTIIYDYGTGELDVTFTGTEGVVDHPKFVRINIEQ